MMSKASLGQQEALMHRELALHWPMAIVAWSVWSEVIWNGWPITTSSTIQALAILAACVNAQTMAITRTMLGSLNQKN